MTNTEKEDQVRERVWSQVEGQVFSQAWLPVHQQIDSVIMDKIWIQAINCPVDQIRRHVWNQTNDTILHYKKLPR
jgi:hypothetical protein